MIVIKLFLTCLKNFLKENIYSYKLNKFIIKVNILKKIKKYNVLKSKYCKIYYLDIEDKILELILSIVNEYFLLLKNDFDIKYCRKIKFIIYPNYDEMNFVMNTFDENNYPIGSYYAEIIHIINPKIYYNNYSFDEFKKFFLREGPIIHEMSHLFLDLKAKGNYEIWFSEGVALYFEYKYTNFIYDDEIFDTSNILWSEMDNIFKNLHEYKAYILSFNVILNFVNKYSENELKKIFISLSKHYTFDFIKNYIDNLK